MKNYALNVYAFSCIRPLDFTEYAGNSTLYTFQTLIPYSLIFLFDIDTMLLIACILKEKWNSASACCFQPFVFFSIFNKRFGQRKLRTDWRDYFKFKIPKNLFYSAKKWKINNFPKNIAWTLTGKPFIKFHQEFKITVLIF